jgi:glycosyltransferase involved in cell wall biosynthesis
MIIGIDVREGVKTGRAGKGEYVYMLVSALLKSTEHNFVLFADQTLPPDWQRPNVKAIIFKSPMIVWQLQTWLYLEFRKPVDVYFSTTSLIIPALLRGIPVVTTLFDFVSFLFPNTHQKKAIILERLWMKPAIRYSKKLLAISEHTKQDAMKLFHCSGEKIVVTPLAPSFNLQQEQIDLTGENIILFVGTLEPRKNLVRLIEAFNLLREDNIPAQLVLAGNWGWQSEDIKAAVENSPFKLDIKVLGYVSSNQKVALYRRATVFVFPSLYEGFGLPPLEAMSLGVSVITSNVSSLPEVVGDAGLLVDPLSVTELQKAIKRVLTDNEFREQLIVKGKARAEQFNWAITAVKTLTAIFAASSRLGRK